MELKLSDRHTAAASNDQLSEIKQELRPVNAWSSFSLADEDPLNRKDTPAALQVATHPIPPKNFFCPAPNLTSSILTLPFALSRLSAHHPAYPFLGPSTMPHPVRPNTKPRHQCHHGPQRQRPRGRKITQRGLPEVQRQTSALGTSKTPQAKSTPTNLSINLRFASSMTSTRQSPKADIRFRCACTSVVGRSLSRFSCSVRRAAHANSYHRLRYPHVCSARGPTSTLLLISCPLTSMQVISPLPKRSSGAQGL